jgi:hypothetical protein
MEKRNCKGCGAKLYFVKDPAGKVHPLDAEAPVFNITKDLMDEFVAVRVDSAFVTHFKTCPKANDFSSSNKKKCQSNLNQSIKEI